MLEIAKSVYQPAPGARALEWEERECKAWSLDARQARELFRLSQVLPEGKLHDFDWLPCSIKGRVRAQGRVWEFEINAAATSIWKSGDQSQLMGCEQAACKPLVLMMPEPPGP